MQTRTPLVSVIVPSFNAARFLPALCASLQAQTFRDFEVLIGDDGSTDETRAAVEPFLGDDRFHFTRWEPNRGVTQGTLLLLEQARGQYWAYPGADDAYEPQFLERRMAWMDAHPAVGLVHGRATLIDEHDAVMESTPATNPMSVCRWPEKEVLGPARALPLLLQHNVIGTPSVLIRMAATKAVLAWMRAEWRYAQDWSFWILHAAAGYDIAYDDSPLHRYRIVQTSLTNDPAKAAWRGAEIRLVPLWALSRAAEFSFAAGELWARWGRTLYSLWLRRACLLARAGTLNPGWLQAGGRAFYGPSAGQVRLGTEVVRHGWSILRSSWRERAARQRQQVQVSGLAEIDLPFFRKAR